MCNWFSLSGVVIDLSQGNFKCLFMYTLCQGSIDLCRGKALVYGTGARTWDKTGGCCYLVLSQNTHSNKRQEPLCGKIS